MGELARCADLLAFQLGKETTGQHLGSGSAAAAAVRRLLGFSFVSLCQGRAITTCWTRGRGTCQYQPRAARCSKLQDNICSNTSVLVGKAQESSEGKPNRLPLAPVPVPSPQEVGQKHSGNEPMKQPSAQTRNSSQKCRFVRSGRCIRCSSRCSKESRSLREKRE